MSLLNRAKDRANASDTMPFEIPELPDKDGNPAQTQVRQATPRDDMDIAAVVVKYGGHANASRQGAVWPLATIVVRCRLADGSSVIPSKEIGAFLEEYPSQGLIAICDRLEIEEARFFRREEELKKS